MARETLEERAQRAILRESFFRWESAVTLGLFGIIAAIASLPSVSLGPSWAWLLAGGVAEAALVYSSLRSPEFGHKVVAKMLKQEYQPQKLADRQLQAQMNEALDYRARIEEAIRHRTSGLLKDELTATASQIDEWLEHMYTLASRVDRYRQQRDIVERDQKRAKKRIRELQQTIDREGNSAIRQQMEDTLAGLYRQVDTLNKLTDTIQRAELQLENTLTHLATIYSQTMLVNVKDIDSSRAKRLRHEIAEEVTELQDMLSAMDEVYAAESLG
ncbi:MAG: hypothetical protein AAF614_26290 [Chloroflexota bacterium]